MVDLGRDIGSPVWWRGVATLAIAVATLVRLTPGLAPLPTAAPPAPTPTQQRELAAIGVAPRALGGDSGRAVAPGLLAEPLTAMPERPRVDLVASLSEGDGLARLLEREGASAADSATAAALVSSVAPRLADGTRVAIALGRRPDRSVARPLDALSLRARIDLAVSLHREAGRLVIAREAIAVDDTPARIAGPVGFSLYRAARASGVPLAVLAEYLRAIEPHVDVGEIRADDRFDVAFEERRAETGEIEIGRLLYAGLVHAGRPLRLLRWTLAGREHWFDAAGAGANRTGFAMPVAGRVTSGFGLRFHPILGYSRMHQGIDLAAPAGTPIVAASDGRVAFAGWHGGHGNYVLVAHEGGLSTGYGHMSRIAATPGEQVSQGEVIGYVGSTGLSTGPHLHFEVFHHGVAIDPAAASFAATPRIAGADLAAFRARLARLTALPPR
ncbi:M23 family metallopeptidase [Sphingomonas sp.]|uniref:M23 family metallopeptidase n=1 Tax=Sphingomonas sp. TaxID=28214 RepID=UPI003B006652